ncbi:hypothetical protein BSKO_02494 [Bryopsis sp. KO-2023]|nr:hypothetical protein BSKO_02494 [Bryopsis sp. KO-2023]
MRTKDGSASLVAVTAVVLVMGARAREENLFLQDCDSGPPPPADFGIFIWVRSGFEPSLSGDIEAVFDHLGAAGRLPSVRGTLIRDPGTLGDRGRQPSPGRADATGNPAPPRSWGKWGRLWGGSGESQELREIRSKGFHESCVTLARDKTIVKVNDAVVEAISQSASTVSDGGDGQAQAEVAATAIGKAVAKALAGAGVDLEVIGQGSAKGIASTQAPAIAKATAKAVAKAIAEVTQGFCRSRNDRRKSWEVVPEASGEISSEVKDESTASVDSRSEATGEGRAEGSAIGDATAKQVVPGQPSEAKPTETKPVTD